MPLIQRRVLVATLLSLCVCVPAPGSDYDFTLLPPSGVAVSQFDITAMTDGTLRGDYDATSNPTGTRTKPGLFGSFGATENEPVTTSLDGIVSGMPVVDTEGEFDTQIDTNALTIAISNYQAATPFGASASLDLSLGFGTEGFRTREPTSVYPPGSATIPFGSAMLTNLELTQLGPPGLGTLAPMGPNQFTFTAFLPVSVTFTVDVLGNVLTLPGIPVVLPLTGSLDLTGPEALLISTADFSIGQTLMPNLALPDLPLQVPTLFPPGGTANLIFSLQLSEIAADLSARVNTTARGVLVPEPQALFAAMLCGLLVVTRRPRR